MRNFRHFLAASALLLAGCAPENHAKYRESWERVTLPGFSIELPPGKVVTTSTVPSAGKHELTIEGSYLDQWMRDIVPNGLIWVSWSNRVTALDEWKRDDLPALITGFSSNFPGSKLLREEKVDDDRWIVVVGTDRLPVAIGSLSCDAHFRVEIMYAHYHDVERQIADVREMMHTVRCEVAAANHEMLRAATRLPERFGLVNAVNPQHYRSLDGEDLALNYIVGNVNGDLKIYRLFLRELLSSGFGAKVDDSRIEDVSVPGILHPEPTRLTRARLPDPTGQIYVGSVYCDDVKMSLIMLWSAPVVSDQLAIQRLSQVGCPSTPSTPTPAFDSLVESACAGGDAAACALGKEPAS